jgi:hypothetical protein
MLLLAKNTNVAFKKNIKKSIASYPIAVLQFAGNGQYIYHQNGKLEKN